ncbi:MAG: pyrimidine reductase family protein [Aeromicrobium sp.]
MDLDPGALEEMYAYPPTREPWIRTNFVSTLDGAAYAADGRSGSLGGPADTRVFGLLRSLADVIIVGAGTARAEGYGRVRPGEVDADLRHRHGLKPIPPIAVVSRSLNIPVALIAPGQMVITTEDAPKARVEALGEQVEVIAAGTGEIDWDEVKNRLAAHDLNRVLCEGGPTLHGQLIERDLVDELCLSIAPVMSTGAAPRIGHGPVAVENRMTLGHAVQIDDLLLTRWVRKRD